MTTRVRLWPVGRSFDDDKYLVDKIVARLSESYPNLLTQDNFIEDGSQHEKWRYFNLVISRLSLEELATETHVTGEDLLKNVLADIKSMIEAAVAEQNSTDTDSSEE